jgi:hypothetical protein
MMDAVPNGKPLQNGHNDDTKHLVFPTLPGQSSPEERGQGPFETYPYKDLMPIVTPKIGVTDPPLEDYEHVDPGFRALKHPDPLAFLRGATKLTNYAPTIGTEVDGVNLVSLTSDGRDELALEVAKRKVMVSPLLPIFRKHQLSILRSSATRRTFLQQDPTIGRHGANISVCHVILTLHFSGLHT